MKKNSVLIISHSLELGGAERSLIGLLWALNKQNLHINLFLLRHEGALMDMIPSHVHLLPEIPAYTVLARPMKETLREGHVLLTAARLIGKTKARQYVRSHHLKENGVELEYSHKYTYQFMPTIKGEYDVVISFLTPHYIAAYRVKAKKKICWIHTDYCNVSIDRKSEFKMWDGFDWIVAVSESAANAFKSVFPELANKVCVIENILHSAMIRRQADKPLDKCKKDDGSIKLLSIGRFSYAKNFDNIPEICKFIRDAGLNVKWYLIGYGKDEALIRRNIQKYNMNKYVIILGKKDNPYPYIKACDLYIQPSRYEGKCVAVREAQMSGKPVIITNYSTSVSQLKDGVDGIIVPMDNEACAKGIIELLHDSKKMETLSRNCFECDYSNIDEVDKLYQLIVE